MQKKQPKERVLENKLDEIPSASVERLCALFSDDAFVVRANALNQLGLHAGDSPEVLTYIEAVVRNPENREPRLFGSVSLQYLGIAALLKSRNAQAQELASQLIKELNQRERETLLEFLENENLPVSAEHLEAA